MALPFKKARTMQIVTLALLFTSFAQIAYWIVDEAQFMQAVLDEKLAAFERNSQIAQGLLNEGASEAAVLARFPELEVINGQALVMPSVVDEVIHRRQRRLVRYGSEGTFLLFTFAAGIATLTYTLKQPAELMRRQENFIAAVSHEFKTPLASLKLSAETLQMREVNAEDQRKLADRMLQDAERLESMVTNILEAGAIDEGRLHLRPEVLPLEQALTPLVHRHSCRAHLQGVDVQQVQGEPLSVSCDRSAFAMIFDNLLGNATKSVAAKGRGTVQVEAAQDGELVRIDVRDDGLGFKPSEAQKLFEKFYRPGDELRRKTKGSGLGLYVVQTLVEASGGRVEAGSSGELQGATFRVWLPRAEGASA